MAQTIIDYARKPTSEDGVNTMGGLPQLEEGKTWHARRGTIGRARKQEAVVFEAARGGAIRSRWAESGGVSASTAAPSRGGRSKRRHPLARYAATDRSCVCSRSEIRADGLYSPRTKRR